MCFLLPVHVFVNKKKSIMVCVFVNLLKKSNAEDMFNVWVHTFNVSILQFLTDEPLHR